MTEIYRDYNGIEFEKILYLCTKMFPRRKYTAYTTKPDESGKKKYVIIYNLTKSELETLEQAYKGKE